MNVKGDTATAERKRSEDETPDVLPFKEEGGFFRLSPDAQSLVLEVAKSQQSRTSKRGQLPPAANQ